jgi:hypothetical protein
MMDYISAATMFGTGGDPSCARESGGTKHVDNVDDAEVGHWLFGEGRPAPESARPEPLAQRAKAKDPRAMKCRT